MSQVLEREVSEGYPVEGKPFEPPEQARDREDPRYVTVLGSMITPEIARNRPWTKFGGVEVSNPCLRYVKHFLRKGRITPVLKDTHNWVTQDYWDKATGKDASYFLRPIPRGYVAPDRDEFGNRSGIAPMYGKMTYPADQIDAIINGSSNSLNRVGVGIKVELSSLKGQPYNPQLMENGFTADPEIWKIQTAIFPDYPYPLPVLLDETESLLIAAQGHTLLRPIVDQMLGALDQFRTYARATVEQTHYMMRELGAKSQVGYIPRYTELDFVFLEQLGMARQDINIRQEAAKAPPSDPELREMFKHFIALQIEEKEMILAERKAQAEQVPAVDENTMAAAPIELAVSGEAKDPEAGAAPDANNTLTNEVDNQTATAQSILSNTVPEFTCNCGKPFQSQIALRMHRNRWCPLKESPLADNPEHG